MQIQVSGKQIDIGDALRTHVSDRLDSGVAKYFGRAVDAHVAFTREGSEFRSDTSVHLSSGISLQASGQAGEIYSAFDKAAERLEKRLRRYKRRLKDHHNTHKERPPESLQATHAVLAAESDVDDEPENLQPVVVAEDVTDVKTLTVGQAVMQLELIDAPVLLFTNSANDALNAVYRRADGNIGWVDPNNALKGKS